MSDIPPMMLSAIICDRVIFDRLTGMPSIINIVQGVNAVNFPIRQAELVFFCELTNGHGPTDVEIRLVSIDGEEKVLLKQEKTVDFKDVRHTLTLAMRMQGVVFPVPGEYHFQLFAAGEFLGERRVICRQVQPPKQENN